MNLIWCVEINGRIINEELYLQRFFMELLIYKSKLPV